MSDTIITDVRNSLARVDGPTATREDVLAALDFAKRLREIAAELSRQAEAGAIAWIDAHGPITEGELRWYVGTNRTHKCRDVRGTLAALLEATGGDLDRVAECLSSSAWKPGAAKAVLPDADAWFETVETPDLKTGKPERRLQKADANFTPQRVTAAPT